MKIGYWTTGRLLKVGFLNDWPMSKHNGMPNGIRLCLTQWRLLQFNLEPEFNRRTGKLLTSTLRSEIAISESERGRYFWGPRYCRLALTLKSGATQQFQTSFAVKRAINLADILAGEV